MEPIAIVLAAGLGTRMKSATPKVLHRVAGKPLVCWTVDLARSLGARKTVVVLGHKLELVQAALDARYGAGQIAVAKQEQQRGTGDAVRSALPALAGEPDDARVLILSGDVPLTTTPTLKALLDAQGSAPLALIGMRPADPKGYGRLVREGGKLTRIVEEKDATPDERKINEVNAGIYAVTLGFLRQTIELLSPQNAQGELYLTDLIVQAAKRGPVPTIDVAVDDVAGINDRVELARLDGIARGRIVEKWQRAGVTVLDPASVFIEADVELAEDVQLGPGVHLRGKTKIGRGTTIDAGCILDNVQVAEDVEMKAYCILTDTVVGPKGKHGPFVHCRPATVLGEGTHLGNFVETKKTSLGKGSKAGHLAYLGDAEIGAGVNVGAGTITCNYDGAKKHTTVLEDGVFIGSDTQLVAPVRVGKGAYVGAGTTVVEDVPADALAISRAPQIIKAGWVEKRRASQPPPKK